MDEPQDDVGARIRRARELRGQTIQDVADALGVDHTTVARVERGQTSTGKTVRRLLGYFGLESAGDSNETASSDASGASRFSGLTIDEADPLTLALALVHKLSRLPSGELSRLEVALQPPEDDLPRTMRSDEIIGERSPEQDEGGAQS